MEQIENIINAIDNKLLETGKEYLILRQANELLMSLGFVEDNKILKKIILEGQLPHAYLTESAPRQWRIPLSKDGLLRKEKLKPQNIHNKRPNKVSCDVNREEKSVRHFICPRCGSQLLISDDLREEEYIRCSICKNIFPNPFREVSRNFFKSHKGWIITIIVIIVLWIIGASIDNSNNFSTNQKVENSPYDASVSQVVQYLKDNLKDPDSYSGVEWSSVIKTDDGGYYVRHKYRAKNSFGGYALENKVFYLDSKGNVINVIDY
ncbi:MAG: hypothetical protein GX416_10530 [Bacteroidales bacterium]|nr:hypothetical protein [Bacteroidales bacterium]